MATIKKGVKKAQNGDSTAYKKTLSGLTSQGLDFEIGKLSKMITPKSAPSVIQQKIDIIKREKSKRSGSNTTSSVKKNKTGGVTKAKDGKWIQKATSSIKRRGTEGKCTPITKKGCSGKAKSLALTFKKMAKKK